MRVIRDGSYQFSWLETKARANRRKHGLAFQDARYAFFDPLAVISLDSSAHSWEERWVLVGLMKGGSLVVVIHTCEESEEGHLVHIISARSATSHEKVEYETGEYSIKEPAMTYGRIEDDEMRDEYDFSNGVRGKYYHPNPVVSFPVFLDPDILKHFSDIAEARGLETGELLNEMLRPLLPAAKAGEGTGGESRLKNP